MQTNGNDPSQPVTRVDYDEQGMVYYPENGLTKREHMAIEFTKALIAGNNWEHNYETGKKCLTSTCRQGVRIANELIKQLNAEKP
jgi:hypothetical protein